ncbi:MAG: YitT family protein [Chloroflexota bacterium]
MHRLQTILRQEAIPFLLATLGFLIHEIGVNFFSWKYKLVVGGFTGYSLFANYVWGISQSSFIFVTCTILILSAFIFANLKIGFKAIYGYLFISLTIDWMKHLFHIEQVVGSSFQTRLLAITVSAVFSGMGTYLFVSNEYSSGNATTMYLTVKQFVNISLPRFILISDAILVALTAYMLGIESAIVMAYGSLILFVTLRLCFRLLPRMRL